MEETVNRINIGTGYNPDSGNVFYHVRWGIRFFFMGFRLLTRHASLMGLSLIPILFTIVVLFSLAAGSAWLIGEAFAVSFVDEVRLVMQALIFVVALALGYFLYMPLARVLLAPLSEMLSRRTHLINTGQAGFGTAPSWKRAMIEGLKLITFQVAIIISVLITGFLFPPAALPAGFVLATFLAGLDFLDVPLSARGILLRKKLRVLWNNKSLAIGFGLAAHLMLIIPGVNLVLLPAGVIGATLLSDALEANSRIDLVHDHAESDGKK
ncbi:MAG: EI24 domain-containing protein [Acidobacteria bacterium]|nr:EI24 domain-containing protein [Acidobacteriota bacterium]